MKLLLIQPTLTAALPENYGRPAMYEPLGLGYLAAMAREEGHDVVILDCLTEDWRTQEKVGEYIKVGMTDEAIGARMREFNPDVVGITCQFTGFEQDNNRLAALARRTLLETPVIAGGADATARSVEYSTSPHFDLVVRGEGEQAFLRVLERYAQGGVLPDDVPGTTVNGVVNPAADEIEDIDAIPLPARDLMPMETYLEDQTPLMPFAKRRPIGFMVSSRGCPYDCIFCSTTKVWRRWRPRDPVKVVDEIEELVQRYGVREIAFQDDSFLVDPERVRRICEAIVRRKVDITWSVPPGLTANRLKGDLLEAMKASGFYRACFPIEAGDPEMLEWIRKPIDLDEVEEAIEACHRAGIWTYGNFIIGFPEQTPESVERTAAYVEDCRLDMVSVYVAQPYAGSDLYDVYAELGLLDPDRVRPSTAFHSLYDTKYFTAAQLRAKRDEIGARFMKRRIRRVFTPRGMAELWRKVNTPENLAYAARVFGIVARQSLRDRRLSLYGSVARKKDKVVRH
jgi:radical SAM superfamily enzyme YgiQ (UPF0313 family)